jgi:DNA-binding PadR family transcriptional regulator
MSVDGASSHGRANGEEVGRARGLSQQDLAATLLVTKGNVTQLLDRMQRDGLIVRCQEGRTNNFATPAWPWPT